MEGTARSAAAFALVLLTVVIPRGESGRAVAAPAGRSHACVFDHQILRTAPGKCRPRARAYPAAVNGPVQQAIYDASLTFGMPYDVLLGIALCESGLDPHARNGHHFGLFQFLPATFKQGARDLSAETGIAAKSYWNALDASYVAGYLFVTRNSALWACTSPSG